MYVYVFCYRNTIEISSIQSSRVLEVRVPQVMKCPSQWGDI